MDTNIDNWKVLYPIYIDKEVSRESGRIVGKEDSIDKPTALEIELALRSLGFPCKYEVRVDTFVISIIYVFGCM